MSDHSTTLEQQRDTGGPARRTYASLEMCRGFRHLGGGDMPQGLGNQATISICPMDERTYWRHVGGGKWNSPAATYEQMEGA